MSFLFNKALKILLITNAFVLVAGAMIGPIYALFVEEVGGSLLDASLSAGFFSLAAGITTILAGKYADRKRKEKQIVSLGYFFMGLGFMLYMIVDSIIFLLVVQLIIGFAEALYAPSFDSLYMRHVSSKKAGVEWGAWEGMSYFTQAGGAALGGLIVVGFGFETIFIVMALLCFASSAYIHHLPRKVL